MLLPKRDVNEAKDTIFSHTKNRERLSVQNTLMPFS